MLWHSRTKASARHPKADCSVTCNVEFRIPQLTAEFYGQPHPRPRRFQIAVPPEGTLAAASPTSRGSALSPRAPGSADPPLGPRGDFRRGPETDAGGAGRTTYHCPPTPLFRERSGMLSGKELAATRPQAPLPPPRSAIHLPTSSPIAND
ncbi:hypothetical protein DL763_007485 [Monosporascus cannonballus]|nr:hypothetical protein DL763_007485 [Monosporascus cannonballus]